MKVLRSKKWNTTPDKYFHFHPLFHFIALSHIISIICVWIYTMCNAFASVMVMMMHQLSDERVRERDVWLERDLYLFKINYNDALLSFTLFHSLARSAYTYIFAFDETKLCTRFNCLWLVTFSWCCVVCKCHCMRDGKKE